MDNVDMVRLIASSLLLIRSVLVGGAGYGGVLGVGGNDEAIRKQLQGSCYHGLCPKTECVQIPKGPCTDSYQNETLLEKSNASAWWWLADEEYIAAERAAKDKVWYTLARRLLELPRLGIVSCLPTAIDHMNRSFFSPSLHLKTAGQGVIPYSYLSVVRQSDRKAFDYIHNHCNESLIYVPSTILGPALTRIGADALGFSRFEAMNLSQVALRAWELGYHVAVTPCAATPALLAYERRRVPTEADLWITQKNPGSLPLRKPALESIRDKYEMIQPISQQMNARLIATTFFKYFPQAYAPSAGHKALATAYTNKTHSMRATAIVMTYGTLERAQRTKKTIIETMCNDDRYDKYIREIVLLFNVVNNQVQPPSDFLDEFKGKARLVISQENDLLNRYNMTLIQPSTSLILLLDDDDPAPPAEEIAARIYVWWKNDGIGTVGIHGRSRVYYREIATNCPSAFALVYTGHGPSGCAWFTLPTGNLLSTTLADAFFDKIHAPLHEFVRKQITHPDDFAFGAFAAWATGRPSISIPPSSAQMIFDAITTLKKNRTALDFDTLKKARRLSSRRTEEEQIEDLTSPLPSSSSFSASEDEERRRLGMAGSLNWHFNRAWAGFWIERYFDGGPSATTKRGTACFRPPYTIYLNGSIFDFKDLSQLPSWLPAPQLVSS